MLSFQSLPTGPALVTGASRGIGREIATSLAAQGLPVAVNYRSAKVAAEEVVHAIRRTGGKAVPLQADLGEPEQVVSLVRRAEEALGPLHVLVNNAGITRDRLLIKMSEEEWDIVWQTDLTGPRIASKCVLSSMMEQGHGRIVNIGSVVGSGGNAGQANYAAAKAAMLGLTRELAVQGAPYGVTANCILPGYITTDVTGDLTPQQKDIWLRRIPMRRPAKPEEVAELVVFLAVSRTSYVTGQCIAIDGGLSAAEGWGLAS